MRDWGVESTGENSKKKLQKVIQCYDKEEEYQMIISLCVHKSKYLFAGDSTGFVLIFNLRGEDQKCKKYQLLFKAKVHELWIRQIDIIRLQEREQEGTSMRLVSVGNDQTIHFSALHGLRMLSGGRMEGYARIDFQERVQFVKRDPEEFLLLEKENDEGEMKRRVFLRILVGGKSMFMEYFNILERKRDMLRENAKVLRVVLERKIAESMGLSSLFAEVKKKNEKLRHFLSKEKGKMNTFIGSLD